MTNQYINRETVKRELISWAVCMNHPEYLMRDDALHVIDSIPAADVVEAVRCRDCKYWVDDMLDEIDCFQPAADVAPVVHAHWQPYEDTVQCSACGFGTFMDGYFFVHGECTHANDRSFRFSFCPNCGAKMDGGTN